MLAVYNFIKTIVLHVFHGYIVSVCLRGLQGGHSGMEIDKGRVNADILLGRILNKAQKFGEFDIISVDGGSKGNAIPLSATAKLIVHTENFEEKLKEYTEEIRRECSAREPGFEVDIIDGVDEQCLVFDNETKEKVLFLLLTAPNGVMSMSAEIENLVETSLNLGVMKTGEEEVLLHFTLRSNKKTALTHIEEKLTALAKRTEASVEKGGYYPPWEFKENSSMQKLYLELFKEKFGYDAKVVAIHAGLECGVFSDMLLGLDCISFGPETLDVHTTKERVSIKSMKETFELVLDLLENM